MTTPTEKRQGSGWQRHFVYRKESLKTTWTLRLSVLLLAVFIMWTTHGFWTLKLGQSLTCKEQIVPSDALLVENFDPIYLVFERAAALQRAGVADKIFVPVSAAEDEEMPSAVYEGFATVMSRIARIQNMKVIPIPAIEPISLNAANRIRDFLVRDNVKSVVVVSPGFRSRRSLLVYNAVLTPAGITVRCVPVMTGHTPKNWTHSWHGIEEFGLQFLKLQYYRFYVLS